MIMRKMQCMLALLMLFYAALSTANNATITFNKAYVGGLGGFGSTTWSYLVSKDHVDFSTPLSVQEGGGVWGLFAGYQFEPNFALEFQYLHFPRAKMTFMQNGYYDLSYNITQMTSNTQAYTISAKLLAPVFNTGINMFASAGGGFINRQDIFKPHLNQFTGVFGAGANYNITSHVLTEVGFNFYTGKGESESAPVIDYVPFLYATTFKLGYRF